MDATGHRVQGGTVNRAAGPPARSGSTIHVLPLRGSRRLTRPGGALWTTRKETTTVKALVTGGCGFIGHHLVRALVERGDEVVVIDDGSSGDSARLDGITGQVRLVEGSVTDAKALDAAMTGVETVFHLAAIPSVALSVQDPVRSDRVNVGGTVEVMQAAGRHGARRVVFSGSSAVYGTPASLPCHEALVPRPESPYGVGKLAAEHYVRTIGAIHGVESVTLRYFNVFGPGQDPKAEYAAVVPRFVTAMLEGRRPTVFGTGETTRDFVHVANVVHANLLAATVPSADGGTFNIAEGHRTSLLELLGIIGDAVGSTPDPIFAPPRQGDILHSYASIESARQVLGYAPILPFRQGIADTVAWFGSRRG